MNNINDSLELAKEMATSKEKSENLEDCLKNRTKKTLAYISKNYNIEKAYTLNKTELCDILKKEIIKELDNTVNKVGNILKRYIEVIDNNACVNCNKLEGVEFEKLLQYGLAYSYIKGEEVILSSPQEIISRLKKQENIQDDKTAIEYIKGVVSLYGLFDIDKFVLMYISQTDKHIDSVKVKNIVDTLDGIMLIDNNIVSEKLYNNKELYERSIKYQSKGFTYKATLSSILNYAKHDYYDVTKEITTLEKFVTDNVTRNKEYTHKIVDNIINNHKNVLVYSVEEYTNRFLEDGYKFGSITIETKVVTLLVSALNSVRMWAYRGYTCNEARNMYVTSQTSNRKSIKKEPITSVKIGRNDPCPCGSGLKYKKCCGKNK